MKIHLDEFLQATADIERYVHVSDHVREKLPETLPQDANLGLQFGNTVDAHIKIRRIFDHHAVIILLYGALEWFIENLAEGFVEFLTKHLPCKSIPSSLHDNHIILSAGILSSNRTERKYGVIDRKAMISNLYSCILEENNYQMNSRAFRQHTANFRHDEVDGFFARLGIDNVSGRIRNRRPLREWLNADKGFSMPEREVPEGTIKELLEMLADRRNEIAHGRWDTELLGRDDLIRYVKFLSAYGSSLYEVIFEAALKVVLVEETTTRTASIGTPIKVFDSRIVCVHISGMSVRIGSIIAAKLPDGGYRWGKVINMQVNNQRVEEIRPEQAFDVGLEVDFQAKANQVFYLLDVFL